MALDFAALGLSTAVEDAPVVRLLQTVFEDAVGVRASDIHIEPQETRLIIRFRIDGLLHVQTEADMKIASAMVLRLKLMSGLDISEKRLPQDGRFIVRVRNAQVDVRISTMPTQYGESVVMRLAESERRHSRSRAARHAAADSGASARRRASLERHDSGDRADRQRQDHDAVRGAARRSTAPSARSSPWKTRSNIVCRASTRCRCRRRSSSTSGASCARRCGRIRT